MGSLSREDLKATACPGLLNMSRCGFCDAQWVDMDLFVVELLIEETGTQRQSCPRSSGASLQPGGAGWECRVNRALSQCLCHVST